MRDGILTGVLAGGVMVTLAGWRLGRRTGYRAGHDAVVVWLLENGTMPESWDPAMDWVGGH